MGVVTQVMCMCVTYLDEGYPGVGARGEAVGEETLHCIKGEVVLEQTLLLLENWWTFSHTTPDYINSVQGSEVV